MGRSGTDRAPRLVLLRGFGLHATRPAGRRPTRAPVGPLTAARLAPLLRRAAPWATTKPAPPVVALGSVSRPNRDRDVVAHGCHCQGGTVSQRMRVPALLAALIAAVAACEQPIPTGAGAPPPPGPDLSLVRAARGIGGPSPPPSPRARPPVWLGRGG